MKNCYINGIGCISAQDSSDNTVFLKSFEELTSHITFAHKPNYKAYIKPTMIRRMSSGVKMGVVASSIALKEANIDLPEAIITGSGMGCLNDSDKFLKNIINNDEQYLTPTSFIQSTHNTVGAQIALGLNCKSYNVTYTHGATSFESSLIDAQLMIGEGVSNILVGGIDEVNMYAENLHKLIGYIKEEETLNSNLLDSNSKGTLISEGAQFFVLANQKKNQSYAKLIDVTTYNQLAINEIENKLIQFLQKNNFDVSDIDIVILGNNGDVTYDSIYTALQDSIFKNTQQLYYKHLSGEYNTVSSFGMWTACQILKKQEIPTILKLNQLKNYSIKNILLYNQYRGENHSFTLLNSC
ncbi:MAG: beta-ketoacyl synthase chain length factor [Flavobacteriaceae bacterium]|nr:beta-ketoacyl synthase chain length factor [Flavobacteriaceae bacterium]